MSRITDAIDAPGNVELPLPGPSGVVASDATDLARAVAALRDRRGLAAAAREGLAGAPEVILVGFSSKTAEPFALGPGDAASVFESAETLLAGGTTEIERDPLWAGHRGHAVWLHPASVDSARLFLALRLAEAIDPVVALASPGSILATATRALDDASALEAALEPGAFDALVAEADAPSDTKPALDVGRSRAIVVFDGFGAAIVAVASGLPLPLGIVDRGGRPYLLPLRPASPAAFLDLLHRAIDRDAEAALTTTGGARLDPGGEPELVGICELVPAARD